MFRLPTKREWFWIGGIHIAHSYMWIFGEKTLQVRMSDDRAHNWHSFQITKINSAYYKHFPAVARGEKLTHSIRKKDWAVLQDLVPLFNDQITPVFSNLSLCRRVHKLLVSKAHYAARDFLQESGYHLIGDMVMAGQEFLLNEDNNYHGCNIEATSLPQGRLWTNADLWMEYLFSAITKPPVTAITPINDPEAVIDP